MLSGGLGLTNKENLTSAQAQSLSPHKAAQGGLEAELRRQALDAAKQSPVLKQALKGSQPRTEVLANGTSAKNSDSLVNGEGHRNQDTPNRMPQDNGEIRSRGHALRPDASKGTQSRGAASAQLLAEERVPISEPNASRNTSAVRKIPEQSPGYERQKQGAQQLHISEAAAAAPIFHEETSLREAEKINATEQHRAGNGAADLGPEQDHSVEAAVNPSANPVSFL